MEIHQLSLLGEIHENVQHFESMSKKMSTCLGGLMVECKANFQKVAGTG